MVDYAGAQHRSCSVGSRQARRFGILMKNKGVAAYEDFGRLTSAEEVAIKPSGESLRVRNIILA